MDLSGETSEKVLNYLFNLFLFIREIKKFFADKLYKTVIPRGVRLSEAPSYGCPIQYYDKRAKGCIAYNDLAKEFLKRNRRG